MNFLSGAVEMLERSGNLKIKGDKLIHYKSYGESVDARREEEITMTEAAFKKMACL